MYYLSYIIVMTSDGNRSHFQDQWSTSTDDISSVTISIIGDNYLLNVFTDYKTQIVLFQEYVWQK